jgi:hypothetical protein
MKIINYALAVYNVKYITPISLEVIEKTSNT